MGDKDRYQKMYPVSWEQLHRDCRALSWRLMEKGPWKGIVAITRGGLVPAAIIARELDIRLIDTICLSSYDWTEQGKAAILKPVQNHGEGWLLIDDLVDTGKTAQIARDMVPKAHFATVYAKPAGRPMVDTYITEVSQDTWILFPWDAGAQFVQPIIQTSDQTEAKINSHYKQCDGDYSLDAGVARKRIMGYWLLIKKHMERSTMKKMMQLLAVSAASLALMLSLFACAEAPEEKKAEEPAAAQPEAVAETAPEAAPAEGAAPAEAKTVKAGFVYVSPVGDAGYSYAHDLGRKAVEELDFATTSFVESVPEGADSERVIRNMARKEFDIIFTTSFGYMDPTIKVAKEFPNLRFMHCSGFKKAENVNNYFGRIYQARYLTGLVAGAMTKSNKLGYVAAFPIPEVIRGINAFTLGVRQVNPEAEVRVVWTKTWYDPALEKDAAKSLLDAGCDVIAQHQDSPAPQEAAQEAGAYSVGYNSDMASFAPKAHLTSAIWNWAPMYVKTVEQVRDGSWQGDQSMWWSMQDGVVDIAPMGPMVPEDVKASVMAKRDELVAGNDTVFAGPIKNQSGEVVVAEGAVMTDGDLLGMTWFVEGVVGSAE